MRDTEKRNKQTGGASDTPSYPASLLLGAVGVAVQAGEDGARRHQLAGLVPAVSVAESGGIALTLLVQDRVQSGTQETTYSDRVNV